MRKNTAIFNRINPADTDYNSWLVASPDEDVKLTTVPVNNTGAGAVAITLAVVPTGTTATSDFDILTVSVGAGLVVDLLANMEFLLVPAGYTLYIKSDTANDPIATAQGAKTSEGNLSL